MAKGLNEIKLIGNVGNAPEVKTFENGNKVSAMSVATSESYRDKQTNELKTITQWHRVIAWGKLAEIIEKYVGKGEKIFINGKLTYREYDSENGKRIITEIVASEVMLLNPPQNNNNGSYQNNSGNSFSSNVAKPNNGFDYQNQYDPEINDDLPF